MKKIADYDTINYDYSTYWEKREYEHKSEVILLEKLLSKEKGNWFLDIGGSYGRLLPTYYDKFSHPVIVDYSLKTLQKNYSDIKKKYPNVQLIAANAYYLPFKGNSFDGCMMVRVLHHINEPKKVLNEIYRLLSKNAIYIQEYANKLHIKAVIRAIVKLDFSIFSKEAYQQPNKENYEGTRKNIQIPFLNYHPKEIRNIISKSGFSILKKYGCSFFRIDFLKNNIKVDTLLFWENILQNSISFLTLSPSIFLKSTKKESPSLSKQDSLEDILVCPKCKKELDIEGSAAKCKKCALSFKKKKNIWDFRI